jgi:hypothetical protein
MRVQAVPRHSFRTIDQRAGRWTVINWAVSGRVNVARAVNHGGSNSVRTAMARQRVVIRQRDGSTDETTDAEGSAEAFDDEEEES